MYLVATINGLHSQWKTKEEAVHQAEVLKDSGYCKIKVSYVNAECKQNGYYYV